MDVRSKCDSVLSLPLSFPTMSLRRDKHADCASHDNTLDAVSGPRDLANPLTKEVKVSCILAQDGITWGRYRDDAAAVLHMTFIATEPFGCKIGQFMLTIEFLPMPTQSPIENLPDNESNAYVHAPTVQILQSDRPSPVVGVAPQRVEDRPIAEERRSTYAVRPEVDAGGLSGSLASWEKTKEKTLNERWTFKSQPLSGKNGYMTAARWTWSCNPANPRGDECGALFGGVAIRHGDRAFLLRCQVKGKLNSGPLPFGFGTREATPSTWKLKPAALMDDIAAHVENMEAEMKTRNTGALAGA